MATGVKHIMDAVRKVLALGSKDVGVVLSSFTLAELEDEAGPHETWGLGVPVLIIDTAPVGKVYVISDVSDYVQVSQELNVKEGE